MSRIETFHSVAEMQSASLQWRRDGKRIGLVPTMGALHEGHLSLIDLVRPHCDCLVVSIFVNPTQFGPKEDFTRYPRDLESDVHLLEERRADVVFVPNAEDMYPKNFAAFIEVEGICSIFEGAIRPGHFRGVCTIVAKLYNIIQPNVAAFGQKDAQQAAVLRCLTRDLHFPIRFLIGPTVREADGLAMSSRNKYLTTEQRPKATVLFRALKAAEARILTSERNGGVIRRVMQDVFTAEPEFEPDYGDVVFPDTFERIEVIQDDVLLIAAGRIGSVRLIDNLPVSLRS